MRKEQLATEKELEFILSQAEKLLDESSESFNSLVNKSGILIAILFALISGEITFIYNLIESAPGIDTMLASTIITTIFTYFALYNASLNLFGKQYENKGSQPNDLYHDWYYTNIYSESQRIKEMLIGEINSYQKRIDNNNDKNKNGWAKFHLSLRITIALPFIFLFAYIVISTFLQ